MKSGHSLVVALYRPHINKHGLLVTDMPIQQQEPDSNNFGLFRIATVYHMLPKEMTSRTSSSAWQWKENDTSSFERQKLLKQNKPALLRSDTLFLHCTVAIISTYEPTALIPWRWLPDTRASNCSPIWPDLFTCPFVEIEYLQA